MLLTKQVSSLIPGVVLNTYLIFIKPNDYSGPFRILWVSLNTNGFKQKMCE